VLTIWWGREVEMGQKPRRAPRDVPDSLPPRDEGSDVAPDDIRPTEPSRRVPPDSLPDEKSTERETI
jgi:hypothetical protein